jgi:hypothetical protein
MSQLLRFGEVGSNRVYYFDSNNTILAPDPGTLRDNFGDVVASTTRLPGLTGGYDHYGKSSAPGAIGKIEYTFTLQTDTLTEMDAKRRDIRAMQTWGVQKLYRSVDFDNNEQWCHARINNIDFTETYSGHTHFRQQFKIIWQVADPHWLNGGTVSDGPQWGGAVWGQFSWGGSGGFQKTVAALSNGTYTLTYNGAVPAPAIINLQANRVMATNTFTLERLVNGSAVDRIKNETGGISANDLYVINAGTLSFTRAGNDAFSAFAYRRPEIFVLEPGDNTIKITNADSQAAITVWIKYQERYR